MEKIYEILYSENSSRLFTIVIDFFAVNISLLLVNLYISEFSDNTLYILLHGFLFILFAYILKIYNSILRYFNFFDFKKVILACILTVFFIVPYDIYYSIFSFDLIIIKLFILFSVTISYRLIIKSHYNETRINSGNNTLIIGAGNNGITLKRSFYSNYNHNVIGFIDDDHSKIGRSIDGVLVYNFEDNIEKVIIENNVKKIIFSTQKITSKRKDLFVKVFKKFNIEIFNLGKPSSWINNKPSLSNLKKIRIEDLLSRSEITISINENLNYYKNKTILITGGAGSIGSEIVRQLLVFKPKKIIIIDNNETSVFHLSNELSVYNNIEFNLLSVTSLKNCETIFKSNKINYVFHAAAFKHVPILEQNPKFGVSNNIIGTINCMELSIKYGVSKFLLVSTDKAVRPTSIMGASKRICELICASKTISGNFTEFITTRFGNVLGSNGSVIPIFTKQIESGGPITLTHEDITRYFMTIPEASKLVVEACRLGNTNQVFLFDMGKPIKIFDLATQMISLYGYTLNKDIEIKIVGLRPGEKLHEELLIEEEKLIASSNKYIFICEKEIVSSNTSELIDNLIKDLLDPLTDNYDIVRLMKTIVPEFKSNNSIYSEIDNEKNII